MKLKKYIFILIPVVVLIASKANATEECFEGASRAIFKFNMAFDNVILEPIAKGYNKLPEPIKKELVILHPILEHFSQFLIMSCKVILKKPRMQQQVF